MDDYKFDMKLVEQFFKYDYHDRGMVKWQGFFLSDHTNELKKQNIQNNRKVVLKQQQDTTTIKNKLYDAYKRGIKVVIQMNEVDTGLNPIEHDGMISNLDDNYLYINNKQKIFINDVRAVLL
ncbi:hypothetical protein R4B61_07540 (plasmid) [Fructilactobacillus vespulae]|uniref:hypothetical protein n=1 Tax=Fructilactobacillus vespulae TaxID=1249630 RepID=UPI0039B37EBA